MVFVWEQEAGERQNSGDIANLFHLFAILCKKMQDSLSKSDKTSIMAARRTICQARKRSIDPWIQHCSSGWTSCSTPIPITTMWSGIRRWKAVFFSESAEFYLRDENRLLTKEHIYYAVEQHEYVYFFLAGHLDEAALRNRSHCPSAQGLPGSGRIRSICVPM